jgi:hypothetical protein
MTSRNIELSSWDTLYIIETKKNSVACSPQANYADRAAAAC